MRAHTVGWIFLIVLTAALGAGCGRPEIERRVVAFEAAGDEVKLLSVPVNSATPEEGEGSWPPRRDALLDLLADQGADVVCLQEAKARQVRDIRRGLPTYQAAGVGSPDTEAAGQVCPILYRRDRFELSADGVFWFSNTPWEAGSRHWDNELPRVCTWVRLVDRQTGQGFFVYNLQLDGASAFSREESARLLVRQIARRKPAEPVIAAGDFYDGADSRTLRILRGQEQTPGAEGVELVDTWLPTGLRTDQEGTYHEFGGRREGVRRDMILTGPEAEVLWAEIDRRRFRGQYPSDHFPVTAMIRLPAASF